MESIYKKMAAGDFFGNWIWPGCNRPFNTDWSYMLNFKFKRLYNDLQIRVKEENKTDSSWLMGFVQGLGNKKLTGYQFAALVDLLLVHPVPLEGPAVPDAQVHKQENKPAAAGFGLKRP